MARAGRKRKQGKRTKSGRLSRASAYTYDKGTERAQAMQVLYGQDGADAIGRAYRAGFLGQGSEAKALLDTARNISNAYWQAYETGAIRCTLADQSSGSVVSIDHERVKRREQWLEDSLAFVNSMGHDVRRAFDQLCIDVNPDSGPAWLDRLLFADRSRKPQPIADIATLRKALDALDHLKA